MGNFDIYVDSGANIPDEIVRERGIKVISYHITVNGTEYICGADGTPFPEKAKKFYAAMREGAEVKTSLINAHTFCEEITPSLEAGRDVLLFTISSGISTTNKQARLAKELSEKEFPGRKVYVLDSANASMGEGLLALRAADLRDLGESAEATAGWVAENTYRMNSYLTVGDLRYLKKTGRISATLAIAGTILNIKPVLRADGGSNAKIVFFDKARGRKKAVAALADAFKERAVNPEKQTVAICHCDCEDEALALADEIRSLGAPEVIVNYYDLCTGSHVGPGTIALFFWGQDRRGNALPHEAKQPHGKPVRHEI